MSPDCVPLECDGKYLLSPLGHSLLAASDENLAQLEKRNSDVFTAAAATASEATIVEEVATASEVAAVAEEAAAVAEEEEAVAEEEEVINSPITFGSSTFVNGHICNGEDCDKCNAEEAAPVLLAEGEPQLL